MTVAIRIVVGIEVVNAGSGVVQTKKTVGTIWCVIHHRLDAHVPGHTVQWIDIMTKRDEGVVAGNEVEVTAKTDIEEEEIDRLSVINDIIVKYEADMIETDAMIDEVAVLRTTNTIKTTQRVTAIHRHLQIICHTKIKSILVMDTYNHRLVTIRYLRVFIRHMHHSRMTGNHHHLLWKRPNITHPLHHRLQLQKKNYGMICVLHRRIQPPLLHSNRVKLKKRKTTKKKNQIWIWIHG